jgi:hypothetical protein
MTANSTSASPSGNDHPHGRGDEVQIEPGGVYPGDIEPMEMPRGSDSIDKMITLTRGLLELALPSIVQGIVADDQSGYAINQATYLARLAWDPIVDNASFALSERTEFESYLIDHCIMEPVHVYHDQAVTKERKAKAGYLSIGPDDLDGVHRYNVKLDPETPSNKVILLRTLREAVAAGFQTQEDAITEWGKNPDEVERGNLLWKIKNSQQVQDEIVNRVLKNVAAMQLKRVEQANAKLGEGMPGQPGAGLGNIGQVFQPGQNGMPIAPPPAGSVTGMGPGGPMQAGSVGGAPVTPNAPMNFMALPGQG